jgi:glycine dehydrogenase
MSAMYAVYHGPDGIRDISNRVFKLTEIASNCLKEMGYEIDDVPIFDTIAIGGVDAGELTVELLKHHINIRKMDESTVSVSFDETHTPEDVAELLKIFAEFKGATFDTDIYKQYNPTLNIPEALLRTSEYLTHDIFNDIHSESQMLRYLYRL